MVFAGAIGLHRVRKSTWSLLQVIGAGGFVIVALTHVAEAQHALPWMRWGRPDSPGHYLDLVSAVMGVTLFPVGYLGAAVSYRRLT